MRNRRRFTKKFKQMHPREINKFYRVADTNGGHPAQVFFIDSNNEIYFVVRFTQSSGKGRKKMRHNIDPLSNEKQFVMNIPRMVKYEDLFYKEEYLRFRIHDDDKKIVNQIKSKIKNDAGESN